MCRKADPARPSSVAETPSTCESKMLPSISICKICVNHTCVKDFRIDLGRWKFRPLEGRSAVAQTGAPTGYIGAYET
jgi:hypothetical protein